MEMDSTDASIEDDVQRLVAEAKSTSTKKEAME
jgi:hypothetical protein